MNTRKVYPVLSLIMLPLAAAHLWSCDQATSPPVPESRPALIAPPPPKPSSAPATMAAAPKPVQLTKPPVLGPPGPAIVILPDQMAEPQIRVRITDDQDRPPTIARGKYRGTIETLRLPGGKYIAINRLPLDAYLQGVLAKELYGSWDPAAYRAQAVAARTFALFQMLTDGRTAQWDVNNDESSQMYGGIAGETAKALAAVADTRGLVLLTDLNGRQGIFCARYSACIGGASQDPFEAWGDSTVAPLAAHVTGPVDDNCDKFNWNREFVVSRSDLSRCIRSWGERNTFPYLSALGPIEKVTIHKRSAATSRPTELLLTDVAGKSAPIRAEEFRLALLSDPLARAPKPYSSNFEIRAESDAFILFNGHGFGHGIGLSQWGAQNLALKGYTHPKILAFFYPGAQLKQIW